MLFVSVEKLTPGKTYTFKVFAKTLTSFQVSDEIIFDVEEHDKEKVTVEAPLLYEKDTVTVTLHCLDLVVNVGMGCKSLTKGYDSLVQLTNTMRRIHS